MNKLFGNIETIQGCGHLSLVSVNLGSGLQLSAIVIETPDTAPYLSKGGPIGVLFKETEVVIAVGDGLGTSLENRLPVQVDRIEEGTLMCRLELQSGAGPITAVVEARGARRLGLAPGQHAYALIPCSEIMLAEV